VRGGNAGSMCFGDAALPKGLYCGIIRSWMRKGFTLVEMLIVVVVLVTLMTMVFRLGSIGSTSSRRTVTISRLQRLENCLSGYYAAFGTYPPVAQHGSRNPWLTVSMHGIQNTKGQENRSIFGWDAEKFRRDEGQSQEYAAWRQVEAACKSQPVDCKFPYPKGYSEFIAAKSEQLKMAAEESTTISDERKAVLMAGFDDGVTSNPGRFSDYQNESDWREVQLFKFGLMSYLLPRYLVMMTSDPELNLYDNYDQWTSNNGTEGDNMPSNALTGRRFSDWRAVCENAISEKKTDIATVANIPSQAVCARWMANLEGIVTTPHSLSVFGVPISRANGEAFSLNGIEIFVPGGFDNDGSGAAGQYVLDSCSVSDGWENEFYYYSPAPYQTYVLWSAGPNGRTFPPWISREELDSAANKCIGAWTEDDIIGMSH